MKRFLPKLFFNFELCVAFLIIQFLFSSSAYSQQNEAFESEKFFPATDLDGGLTVPSPVFTRFGDYSFGTWFHYDHSLIKLQEKNSDTLFRSLLSNRIGGQAIFGYTFGPLFQLNLKIPYIISQDGQKIIKGSGNVSAQGIGTARLGGKFSLKPISSKRNHFALSLVGLLPVDGQQSNYATTKNFQIETAFSYLRFMPYKIVSGAQIGYHFLRKHSINAKGKEYFQIPDQSFWGVYAKRELWTPPLWGIVELNGSVPIANGSYSSFNTPAEILLAVNYRSKLDWNITSGFGMGLTSSVGLPDYRIFIAFIKVFKDRDTDGDGIYNSKDACITSMEDKDNFEDGDGCPEADNDKDGLGDEFDKCPNEAEDWDGFEDNDGCHDKDNDGDGILDVADRCPLEKEDFDHFEDEDGCPEIVNDSDHDLIADIEDKCPNEPEDKDGDRDHDGCPESPDSDSDGVDDDKDECISEPEDKDGFEDADGCPESDNDKDGFLDKKDECPVNAEDYNNFQDWDGCPDEKDKPVSLSINLPSSFDWIYFEYAKSALDDVARKRLDEMAQYLAKNPDWNKIIIKGHTDTRGSFETNVLLSQSRAGAVKDYLVAAGVPSDKIRVYWYGKSMLAIEGRAGKTAQENRRVEIELVR